MLPVPATPATRWDDALTPGVPNATLPHPFPLVAPCAVADIVH